jgi:hypothetical protein
MCCSCIFDLQPLPYNTQTDGYRTQSNALAKTVTSLFCTVVPLLITTASLIVFAVTGHPLALSVGIVGTVWFIIALITVDDDDSPQPQARRAHLTRSVSQPVFITTTPPPSPAPSIVILPPPAPQPMNSQPNIVFMPQIPPSAPRPQPTPPQPNIVFTAPQPMPQQQSHVHPSSGGYERTRIGKRDSSNTRPLDGLVSLIPSQPTPTRASVGRRTNRLNAEDTPRVVDVTSQYMTPQDAQARAPVGKRK